jgi:Ca-activated chloride channel family protein
MIPGCRFNIVGFGSTVQPLFRQSRQYDQATLAEASAHVAAVQADLGGTEMLGALQFALQQPTHAGLARQLVVLTDGEVTNTDAVLALVKQHAADARIFTFGIGAGASQHLVRGVARKGRGAAEFIYPGERVEPKVVGLFGRLLSPALVDVRLEWVGASVTQAPLDVPPVFAGSRLLVYGFTRGARPTAVRLSATSPSGPQSFEVPIGAAPLAAGRAVATLAARARIRELEEGGEWLSARGSRQTDRKHDSVRKEIIELSVKYGLISRETSFVAIERRDTPVQGDVQLRRVPVALTSGWGAIEEHSHMQWGTTPLATPARARAYSRVDLLESSASVESRWGDADRAAELPSEQLAFSRATHAFDARSFGSGGAAKRLRARTAEPPPGMDRLVALQAADGSWELTSDLAAVIGRSLTELEAALAGSSGAPDDVRRAWATALALAWLQTSAVEVAGEWRMLGAKARKWIDGVSTAPAVGRTWIDMAKRFLAT